MRKPTDYRYTIQDLLKEFSRYHMPVSRMWLYRQEAKGNLVMPRSTTNFKKARGVRKAGAVRVFTYAQIQAIVAAFLPGGKGYWRYDK